MITEIQLSTLVFIAAAIWGTFLLIDGIPLSKGLFEPFSSVTGVLVLLLAFFDKWAWRWKIFHPWLVATPFIAGTWKGKINSSWMNPETKQRTESINVYLVVRQKFSKVNARLITKESSSELLSGEIIKSADETWQFVGTYRNISKLSMRKKSPIHHGAMILMIKGQPPSGLDGQYWTDRNTQGEINFSGLNSKRFEDFRKASAAKYKYK